MQQKMHILLLEQFIFIIKFLFTLVQHILKCKFLYYPLQTLQPAISVLRIIRCYGMGIDIQLWYFNNKTET